MPLLLGGSSAVAAAYSIDNSCRFIETDDVDLYRAQSAGDRTKWTVSMWIKRCTLATTQMVFFGGDSDDPRTGANFTGADIIDSYNYSGGVTYGHLQTNKKFRDPGAWWHLVYVWDTSNVTAGDRMILYINGVSEGNLAIDANPVLDQVSEINNSGTNFHIGADGYRTVYNFDGYIAEAILCDGQAYAASDFGEFNADSPTIWQPKDPSGLTFGTNGFWLDFKDSSALGNDVSGNNNDFTATNLLAVDQSQDSPTNNFAVYNVLDRFWQGDTGATHWTYTAGNTKVTTDTTGNWGWNVATLCPEAGRWYCEVKMGTTTGTCYIGVAEGVMPDTSGGVNQTGEQVQGVIYKNTNGYAQVTIGGSETSYGDSFTVGDIMGIYLDITSSKVYFAKNGTIQNSGTGLTLPSAPINGWWTPICQKSDGGNIWEMNFGNGCFGTAAVASSNADANGYGLFEYDPSDGGSASFDGSAKDFLCMCTKNLGSDGG